MTTFDKMHSNKNEIFALCSKDTTSQDFMTGSSQIQLFHQIIFWETANYSVGLLQSVLHFNHMVLRQSCSINAAWILS